MARTATRKRSTSSRAGARPANRPPTREELDAHHERRIAEGARVWGGFTTREIKADAQQFTRTPEEGIVVIEANVEIVREDGHEDAAIVTISTSRAREDRGWADKGREDGFHSDGFRLDELEAVAVALAEAVRLGKAQGIIPGAAT